MAVNATIDLTAKQRRTVLALLNRYLPNTTVWAYGSRVKWTSQPASDLDLVAFAEPGQTAQLAELREAFDESDLPFRVDLFVWDNVPEGFHARIEAEHMALTRTGMEETPVGNGWSMATLDSCAVLVGDKVAPASRYDTPYIGLEHIGQGTLSLLGIGKAQDVEATKTAFRSGDILFGKLRPYFRKVAHPRFDGICSTDIWVVRPLEGVDAGFLFYMLASPSFVEFANQGAEGTRMPRAKWEHVKRFPLALPTSEKQRSIARVLSALDDKIELNRRTAKTLDETVRALFKSWFVDFDPVRAKVADLDTHLSDPLQSLFPDKLVTLGTREVPEGWFVRSLEEIACFQNGLALQKYPPTEDEGRLPVLKIAQLRSERLDEEKCASSNIPANCIVENGDVIFSWSGSLMAKVWCGGRAALNQHLFKVTSVEYGDWFILGWLHLHMPEFMSIAADKATTMGHIKRRHLRDALCVVPSEQVLSAADGVCAAIHRRYVDAKVESQRLSHLRDTLLPKMLSGEIRVADAEVAFEADV